MRAREPLGDQVNVKVAVDVREFIEEWADSLHLRTGGLCRVLIEDAVRAHAAKTGQPIPPSLSPSPTKQARGGGSAPKRAAAGRR